MNVKSNLLLFLLAASIGLPAQTAPQSRVVQPIDESHLVILPGNIHPLAQAAFDQGPAAVSAPTGRLTLVLRRSIAQQQALTQYLVDLQNPGSPNYHKWFTPAQYGVRFGISDADLQTVESWLQSHGLKVERVPEARNAIEFSGNIDALQKAFHIVIHKFQIHGDIHLANISEPEIPAALASVVAGVTPLNDFHPKPNLVMGPSGRYDPSTHVIQPDLTLYAGTTPYLFVDPADAATIYDTPNSALNLAYTGTTYDGTGVNIGIAGNSDLTLADVQNYRIAFLGESAASANLPVVVIDGNDPGLTGSGTEAVLDNEIAGAIAPGATIYFYTSGGSDLSDGLFNAIQRAVNDNVVSIVSVSFGNCEAALGTGGNQAIAEITQQAAAQGISVAVSSGDGGSAGCDNFDTATAAQYGFAVNGLASTPYSIAVGGTDFDVLPNAFATYANTGNSGSSPWYGTALQYIPENPWNDSTSVDTTYDKNVAERNSNNQTNIVAGSGGVSSVYAKPAFQTSLTPSDNARDLPDVALFASNGHKQAAWVFCSDNVTDGVTSQTYTECQTTGGQFTSSTTFGGVGGTSASAPAFAGMLALLEQKTGSRLGQANTVLYQLASSRYSTVFHDITSGNNSVPCAGGSANCGTNGFLTGYNAGTGYDLATGLGSVDVKALIANWSSVGLGSTSTSLQLNGSTAAYSGTHGANITFNVGVSPTAVTGDVAIIDTADETSGGTVTGPQNNGQFTIPLSSGAGSATWNGLPGGTYTVAARYGGDSSNAASTSTPVNVTINPEPSTTTLRVNAYNPITGSAVSSNSNVPYGSIILADAQIEGTAEGSATQGLATGNVTFLNGATTLGTANIDSSNTASWPSLTGKPTILSVGSYSYSASYSGDPSYNSSTSAAVPFTITRAATALTIIDAPTSVTGVYGNASSISFSVSIVTPYTLGAAPTGTLSVTANGQPASTVSNLTGIAQGSGASTNWLITTRASVPDGSFQSGPNAITVTYSGDANYAASTQTINITDTDGIGSFTMTGSGDISVVAGIGGDERLTFTPSGGFDDPVAVILSGVPTGVNISGSAALGNLSNGKGAFYLGSSATYGDLLISTAFNAAPGTYPITVTATDPTGKDLQSIKFNLAISGIPANASVTIANGGAVSMPAGALNNNTANLTITPANGYIGELNLICTVSTSMSNVTSPPTCGGGLTDITSSLPVSFLVSFGTSFSTTPGSYTVTFTVTDKYNPAITATTSFPLTISPAMEVTVSSSGDIVTSPAATGGNSSTLTITPTGGFLGTVGLLCRVSSPADLGCDVSPPIVSIGGPGPVTATLTATAYPTSSAGSYTITVQYTANSSASTFQSSTTVGVTIQNTPAIALSSSPITISPGAMTGNTSMITVTPSNGFAGQVYLSCSLTASPAGASDLPTCSVPTTVTINGTAAATATLTVATTAPGSAALQWPLTRFMFAGGGSVLALAVFLGIPARRRTWRALFSVLIVVAVASAIVGCGGGSSGSGGGGSGGGTGGQTNPGTTPGAYTITVKAADAGTGKITASTNVTLTVS